MLHHKESPEKPQCNMATPSFLDKPLIFLYHPFFQQKLLDSPFPSILKKLNPLYEGGPPPSNYVLIKASGNNKIVIEDSIYCVDNKAVCFAVPAVLPYVQIGELNKRPQFAEGYKIPPEKTQSHLKSQFPSEMTLLSMTKLSDLRKIKFPVHSHLKYILQKVFNMTGVKLTICRLSLIGTY